MFSNVFFEGAIILKNYINVFFEGALFQKKEFEMLFLREEFLKIF